MKAGFVQVDITPSKLVPLAGYADKFRMAEKIRDPIYAKGFAFADESGKKVAIVITDLLLISRYLRAEASKRLQELGHPDVLLIPTGTHNHSGPGSYWDNRVAVKFMGHYQQWVFDFFADGIAKAAALAIEDLAQAELKWGIANVSGLVENRRIAFGPVDDKMPFLVIQRKDKRGLLTALSGHPVVVAEHEAFTMSADYPGEFAAQMKNYGFDQAALAAGAVGGSTVDFNKALLSDTTLHLKSLAARLAMAIASAEISTTTDVLKFYEETGELPEIALNPFPAGMPKIALKIFAPLLEKLSVHLKDDVMPAKAVMAGVRIGEGMIFFHPSDLGVGLALDMKQKAQSQGFKYCMAVGQALDYLGYIHRPQDYQPVSGPGFFMMMTYENLMNFYGHQSSSFFAPLYDRLLAQLQ